MSEMLEKAARALFERQCAQGGKNPSWWPDEKERCVEQVRAVLLEIREPGYGINEAGSAVGDYPWDGRKPSRIFTAMIDEVLK